MSADKKSEILASATTLLKDRGLHELSFEAIAGEAGLSRQLVRYYFASLDDLLLALCDHYGRVYTTILTEGVVQIGSVDRLNFFLDFFFGLAADHPMPDHLEVYDALVAYSVGSAPFRDRLCLQYKTLGDVMSHELSITYPDLPRAACEELSYLFTSMMHAHWSFVASLGHSWDHGKLTRAAMDRLIASYRGDPDFAPTLDRPWARAGRDAASGT